MKNENEEFEDEEIYPSEDDSEYEDFDKHFQNIIEEKNLQKKKRHIRLIISIISAVLVIALAFVFYFTNTGIIGAYKENFASNFKKLFPSSDQSIDIGATEKSSDVQEYVEDDDITEVHTIERNTETVKVFPFDGAASGKFDAYENGLICARTNYISFINDKGTVWEKSTTVVDPLLSIDGRYIAIASENGYKLCLYNAETLIYEVNVSDKIRSIRASANGDVVLVCDKPNYKGAIIVYNKDGQEIFAWSSGHHNIISADISSASRRVAATLLNSDKKVYSIIKVFDINSKTDNVEMAFDDTILFKVDYTGDTITGFGDNSLICMTSTGRVICDKRFDMVDIQHYAFDLEGNKAIHFDSAGIPVFHIYGRKGILNTEIVVDSAAECIDINGDFLLYNTDRSVILRRINSDRLNEYIATMDVLQLVLINRSTYAIIHSNSIEIVKI